MPARSYRWNESYLLYLFENIFKFRLWLLCLPQVSTAIESEFPRASGSSLILSLPRHNYWIKRIVNNQCQQLSIIIIEAPCSYWFPTNWVLCCILKLDLYETIIIHENLAVAKRQISHVELTLKTSYISIMKKITVLVI